MATQQENPATDKRYKRRLGVKTKLHKLREVPLEEAGACSVTHETSFGEGFRNVNAIGILV